MPFGRQDRVAVEGESLSIEVMASIINSLEAKRVIVTDPHSDVTPALIKNCVVIDQCDIFKPYFLGKTGFYLVSPDGGALKKIFKLVKQVDCHGVIECSKSRDVKTGEITGVIAHADDLSGKDCYIIDDICDGGKTFIEIAKVLKSKNCGRVTLMVSHGLFTKGLSVFDGYIDAIITSNGNLTECSDDSL
jgi:ribose-phosphate pyrophosphokinase